MTIRRLAVGLAVCVGLGAGLATSHAGADTSADQIIAARKAGYKHIGQLFGAMKKQGIDTGADVTQFAGPAHEIADWGRKIPTLFPPGTETGDETHALPAIWSDRPTFEKDAADLVTNAEKLETVAASGDKSAFADQWKATAGACGTCHRSFRARLE